MGGARGFTVGPAINHAKGCHRSLWGANNAKPELCDGGGRWLTLGCLSWLPVPVLLGAMGRAEPPALNAGRGKATWGVRRPVGQVRKAGDLKLYNTLFWKWCKCDESLRFSSTLEYFHNLNFGILWGSSCWWHSPPCCKMKEASGVSSARQEDHAAPPSTAKVCRIPATCVRHHSFTEGNSVMASLHQLRIQAFVPLKT